MRIRFSDRFMELFEKVRPYVENGKLKETAPENIKTLYKEWMELGKKEYNAALL